jgi:type II secretory pathway pseudopilin PulG
MKTSRGFGLISLLISVLIIGLLAAYSFKYYFGNNTVQIKDDNGKTVETVTYPGAINQANQARDLLQTSEKARVSQ